MLSPLKAILAMQTIIKAIQSVLRVLLPYALILLGTVLLGWLYLSLSATSSKSISRYKRKIIAPTWQVSRVNYNIPYDHLKIIEDSVGAKTVRLVDRTWYGHRQLTLWCQTGRLPFFEISNLQTGSLYTLDSVVSDNGRYEGNINKLSLAYSGILTCLDSIATFTYLNLPYIHILDLTKMTSYVVHTVDDSPYPLIDHYHGRYYYRKNSVYATNAFSFVAYGYLWVFPFFTMGKGLIIDRYAIPNGHYIDTQKLENVSFDNGEICSARLKGDSIIISTYEGVTIALKALNK